MESKSTETNLEVIQKAVGPNTCKISLHQILLAGKCYASGYHHVRTRVFNGECYNAAMVILKTDFLQHKAKSSTVGRKSEAHPHGKSLTKLQQHQDLHV